MRSMQRVHDHLSIVVVMAREPMSGCASAGDDGGGTSTMGEVCQERQRRLSDFEGTSLDSRTEMVYWVAAHYAWR